MTRAAGPRPAAPEPAAPDAAGEDPAPGAPQEGLPPALRTDPNGGVGRAVVHLAYDLTWVLAALLGSPWLLWRTLRSRAFGTMVAERLGRGLERRSPPDPRRPRVLVHGVSVGEVKGARPIVEAIERAYPELDVLVSTTTDTGMHVAGELFGAERVVRFPLDPSRVVRRFLRLVRPAFVVLVELEIWPNFLRECNRAGIPVAIVNGRITEVSHAQYVFFKKVLPQFNRISLYCVQHGTYAGRFLELEVDPRRLVLTGNVKADGLTTGRVEPGDELRRLLGASPGAPVVVAGSTHAPEERIVARAWRRCLPGARLILVPRHPPRVEEVARALESEGLRPQRLSRLRAGKEDPDPSRPALVDTIGELERVYGLADLAFVGGSLIEHGGQNVLEPAAQGVPVLAGPHLENFEQEAGLLREAGALREVADEEELGRALAELASDPAGRERMGAAGLAAVRRERGATDRTLHALGDLALEALASAVRAG